MNTLSIHEDLDYDAGFETRLESFETEDGVELKLKRYARKGARPVILAHGFLGNGYEFDLPQRSHNLALYLAERGYDVWVVNFRGCGRQPYRSVVRNWNYSMDHLAAFDVPAIIDGVCRAAGKLPVWIGQSMGGMVLYMYLQGASIEGDSSSFRVNGDRDLSAQRNYSILGGVTIASTPAFYGRGRGWLKRRSKSPFFPAETKWWIRRFRSLNETSPRLHTRGPGFLADRYPRLAMTVAMRGPLANFLYNVKNVDPEVGYSLLKWSSDYVTARMAAQMASVFLGDLKDYNGEYNYSRNMDRITSPMLFLTGSNDFFGPENIREFGFEKVSSRIKKFEVFNHYGHTDLVMGKHVETEVFPAILAWLEQLEMSALQALAG
ncbi:MAG: hypothetical protein A2W01_00185 [Candidatus Solincola sediminis]|uniref:AB hydrolase-1 domain-containing protein n=1 Tax=Candidatus Solincola sediminis TaxID=1797199 RepID=A0A1F2WHN6_9ACTN|nr:MAG: hypothetical protein A2Y75_03840 [Candidatus Solincola sediminis]OFW61691.1 MAG: hypothetical protein A2W01_00185 [Candidatus Solincola sediminis]